MLVLLAALVLARASPGRVASFAEPTPGSGKSIELMSGVWTVLMYLGSAPCRWRCKLWR